MSPQTATTEPIGTARAARRLNMDRSNLTRLAKAGKIPIAMRGSGRTGELFFHIDDLDAYLAEHSPAETPAPADGEVN